MNLTWFGFFLFFFPTEDFFICKDTCPSFTSPPWNCNPHMDHLQNQQLLLKYGQKSMPVTSLLADVLKTQANCWGPLPITSVFLILASPPLLIPGKQPKQNLNIPSINLAQIYLLYHFKSFFTSRRYVVFQVKDSLNSGKAELTSPS